LDISSFVDLLFSAGCLFASAGLLVRSVRLAQSRWVKWAAAAAMVISLLLAASAWIRLPQATASRLVGILRENRTEELATQILPPAVWRLAADGSLEIIAEDGTQVMVPSKHLPLLGYGWGERRSLGELVSGRYRFQLASKNGVFCLIDCTAQWGRVRCHHVQVF
jgi:hypothetical protein